MTEVAERKPSNQDRWLDSLRPRVEWQPIETAPKVYSPPLSFYNHHAPEILGLWGKAFFCICRWGGTSQPFWIDGNNHKVAFQPTRWIPLPDSD